jgi:hypothetical protein
MGVDIVSHVAGDGQAQQNLKPSFLGTLFPNISQTPRLDIAEIVTY